MFHQVFSDPQKSKNKNRRRESEIWSKQPAQFWHSLYWSCLFSIYIKNAGLQCKIYKKLSHNSQQGRSHIGAGIGGCLPKILKIKSLVLKIKPKPACVWVFSYTRIHFLPTPEFNFAQPNLLFAQLKSLIFVYTGLLPTPKPIPGYAPDAQWDLATEKWMKMLYYYYLKQGGWACTHQEMAWWVWLHSQISHSSFLPGKA